jgi:multiple sugar transport system permease protein
MKPSGLPIADCQLPIEKRRGGITAGNVMAMIVLLALSIGFLLPFIWSFSASLKPLGKVYEFPPGLMVGDPHWINYPEALGKLPFGRFLLNTLVICLASVAGQLLTGSMAGYAFARLRWPGRNVMFFILLAGMMLPSEVLLIPHFVLFQKLDWVNTYKPLIVPSWLGGSAFFIFLFRQFFRAVPSELEQAARLDGASEWQIYWRIFLPLSKPVLITVGLMSFVAHWQEFMRPLIYLSDFNRYPVSMGLRMYQTMEGSFVNLLMAASLVATVPLVILFLVGQRYFTRSLLLTGNR